LDGDRVAFYHKGRIGVWHAARNLGWPGSWSILVPSYYCGSEVEALRAAGATVVFYRVDRAAHVDVDQLAAALDERCAAVYITHYFGFSQPAVEEITRLCHERRVALVEDCAHALYCTHSGRPLGTFGDLAVFSLPKTLPVPDGGAVVAANGRVGLMSAPERPPINHWADELLVSLAARVGLNRARPVRAVSRLVLSPLARAAQRAGPRRNAHTGTPYQVDESVPIPFDPLSTSWGTSAITRAILRRSPHDAIRKRRRSNYQALVGQLSDLRGLTLIRPELTAGACPYCLPVVTDDSRGLRDHLARESICADLPWRNVGAEESAPELADAADLRRRLVALPVHQDLDELDLTRIAAAVRDWSRGR
jgi:dTDP-4-amino-4,6-dideoxygalactose transaminase